MLLLRVMTYVVFYKLFWNWIGVMQFVSHEIELVLCNLYLMRFDLTKDLLFDTFFIDFFEQIVSLWLLSFWIPIKYQWIGKLKVGTEIKWPMDKISHLTCKRGSVGQSEGLSIPRSSVRFRLNPDTSNSHEFELHRSSHKGTKLLLKVIKAIIIMAIENLPYRWNRRASV